MVMVLPMVCFLGSEPREGGDIRDAPGEKIGEDGEYGVGGGRAAGDEDVHGNKFVDRAGFL